MTARSPESASERKPYWYFISAFDCQLCSHTDVYRERRYDPKPEKWDDRHEYTAVACASHFL